MFNSAPIQTPVDTTGTRLSFPWVQWFTGLYSNGTWTPTFTNLTVVNGTGTAAYQGYYVKLASLVFWTVRITVTGTCTTASTSNTTTITNLPYPVAVPSTCEAVNDATASLWTGRVPSGGTVAYPPSWNAYNGGITITGWYSI